MTFKRVEGPIIVTSIVGIIVIFEYYLKIPVIVNVASNISNWGVILAAFFLGFGVITVFKSHSRKIIKRDKKWIYSLWLLVIMSITIISGFASPYAEHPIFNWIYTYVLANINTAIASLTVFYTVAAMYRSFRVRNLESGLLFLFAFIAILRNAPIGAALFPPIQTIGDWVLNVLNMAVTRGLIMAAALGVLAVGVRTLLGLEKGYLGVGEDEK